MLRNKINIHCTEKNHFASFTIKSTYTQTIDGKSTANNNKKNKQNKIQKNLTSISAHTYSYFIKIDKHTLHGILCVAALILNLFAFVCACVCVSLSD